MKNEKSTALKNDLTLKYDKLSDKTTYTIIVFLQNNELVIGNVSGNLFIYKGLGCKPWAGASDLGMVRIFFCWSVCV